MVVPALSETASAKTAEPPFVQPPWTLLHANFGVFFASLRNEAGHRLRVDDHQEEWAELFQQERLLCLMAPRDHGKSWTDIAYLLWRVWRHNRDPLTGLLLDDLPDGTFEAVLFSATLPQAETFFEQFQNLFLATGNGWLFTDLMPSRVGRRRDVWGKRRVALRNLSRIIIRGYRSSSRGLHPTLIVLDDVLNDTNTLTKYQRDRTWTYFVGTILPMNPSQIIIVGTAFHFDDLLHRLKPNPAKPVQLKLGNYLVAFAWHKYRAINWTTGECLWPWKHNRADLEGKRRLDALQFAREYQNDPVDDSASLFPTTLTGKALTAGELLTFLHVYRKNAGEYVVGGMDLAISAGANADYTVLMIAVFSTITGKIRLLNAYRRHGLGLDDQLGLLRLAVRAFDLDVAIVEENVFQKWLLQEAVKDPLLNHRVLGHRTGGEKADLAQGVPSLRIGLENDRWVIPMGDEESAAFGSTWQVEMAAYGYKDGKLMGVGEHDDTVMATYFLQRGIRWIEDVLRKADANREEIVMAEDLGIYERVRIGPAYP